MARERPLIAWIEALGVQFDTVRALDDGNQQAFGFFAQVVLQAALEARLEQPQAGLHQQQGDHQQPGDQPQAEAALDGLQALAPKR